MTPSINKHKPFLSAALQNNGLYSVAGIRMLAANYYYPEITRLTQALIWHYRSNHLLDHIDGTETINGKTYPAWTGMRWKSLMDQAPLSKKSVKTHWLQNLFSPAA